MHRDVPKVVQHATGDDVVPWGVTYDLWARAAQPKHLRIEMGGGHQSLQHDPRIQDQTANFLAEHLLPNPGAQPRCQALNRPAAQPRCQALNRHDTFP